MSQDTIFPGGTYRDGFGTVNSSGVPTDADALPTATFYRNGALDAGVAVTVTKVATGQYVVSSPVPYVVAATPAVTYNATDVVFVLVSATVGGTAYSKQLRRERLAAGRQGTCQAGSTAFTIKLDAGAATAYPSVALPSIIGWWVGVVEGTGAGQWAAVTDWHSGTQVANVAFGGYDGGTWDVTPDGTSVYVLIPNPGVNVVRVNADSRIDGLTALMAMLSDTGLGYIPAAAYDTVADDGSTYGIPTAAQNATATEQQIMDETDGRAVLAAIVAKINATDTNLAGLTTAAIADAVWKYLIASATGTSGSSAKVLYDLLTAISAKTTNLPATPASQSDVTSARDAVTAAIPAINAIADGLLDRANGIEAGLTPRSLGKLLAALAAGKVSITVNGSTFTVTFRNFADTLNRIVAATDATGQRTAITVNLG